MSQKKRLTIEGFIGQVRKLIDAGKLDADAPIIVRTKLGKGEHKETITHMVNAVHVTPDSIIIDTV